MTNKQATIIYNPTSGRPARRAADVKEMIRLLADRGIDASGEATSSPHDATTLARHAAAAGTNLVVSYGGDGTLNEVIQGLAQTDVSLAVWAGGTANVVARDLAMPFEPAKIADVIAAGKTLRIALGVASQGSLAEKQERESADAASPLLSGSPAESQTGDRKRYFIMMAGIGLDASIARGVNHQLKRRTGEFAYWLTGLGHLFTWDAEVFSVEVDGKRYDSVFTLIGNGKGYGGDLCMAPNAKLDEPWFEVYILPPLSNNFSYLGALAACKRGKPDKSGATLVRGCHIKANSSEKPWVEVDGELIGPLPMTFDAVPDALSVVVP
jgi:diacylglycerol kinase (ATP)